MCGIVGYVGNKQVVPLIIDGLRKLEYRGYASAGIAVINADEADTIIAVRQGPPVVIGLGDREFFVASDIPPILQHTRDVFFLGDGEIAIINRDAVRVVDFEGNSVQPSIQRITWDPIMAEKGGFKHFMLKEIYEQPRSVRDTVQGRVSLDSGQVFLDE